MWTALWGSLAKTKYGRGCGIKRELFLKITRKMCCLNHFTFTGKLQRYYRESLYPLHTASWDANVVSHHSSFVRTKTLTREQCSQAAYGLHPDFTRLFLCPGSQANADATLPFTEKVGFVFHIFDSGGLAAGADGDGLVQVSEAGRLPGMSSSRCQGPPGA